MDVSIKHVNPIEPARLTRKEIFELFKTEITHISAKEAAMKIEELLLEKFQKRIIFSEYDINHKLSPLLKDLKKRYIESYYSAIKFDKTNADWLDRSVDFFDEPETSDDEEKRGDDATNARGRRRTFTQVHHNTKRRRTSEMRSAMSTGELYFALTMKLRADRENDLVKILTDIAKDKNAAKVYRELYENKVEKPVKLSKEEAKEFLIANNITSRQYQAIKNLTRSRNADILPAYKTVMKYEDCSSESET